MVFSRNLFFLIIFGILVTPLPFYKLIWLATSRKTQGTMYFEGHDNFGSVLGISSYPVIKFRIGADSIIFKGNVNIPLKPRDQVPVRYQVNNPSDAKIDTVTCIWGDTIAYDFAPVLIFLVIFFHPDLVPKRARIEISKKRGIRYI